MTGRKTCLGDHAGLSFKWVKNIGIPGGLCYTDNINLQNR